jgi:hemerythrin
MALIEWSDKLTLGVERMDETHREFIEQLNALHGAPQDSFIALLERFIEHTEAHFEQEERWMAEINFPPLHCHTQEHAGVLDIMREVRRMVGEGKLTVGKVLTKELAPWFENHAATMDATLAFFLRSTEAGLDPMQELAAQQQGLCASGAAGV